MARIRTIKPEFWSDEKLGQISRDARLLFVGFWNLSDDYGVLKGHFSWIKSQLFPYDDLSMRKFQNWVNELLDHKFILPFNENGEKFFYIRHFASHQVINRPSKQRNPEPPEDIESSVSPHGALPSGREGKGKEGKGVELRSPETAFTSNGDFISSLKENPAYKEIDVEKELHKMDAWLSLPKNRGRKKTQTFILRWLNKIDKPMEIKPMEVLENNQKPEPARVQCRFCREVYFVKDDHTCKEIDVERNLSTNGV